MSSHLWFCCFQNCCLLSVHVQVSYKQLRPYKDREQKEASIPWQLENIFLHSRASFYLLFSLTYFLTFPAQNQIIRQTRQPLSFISVCITSLEFRLHCFVYYLMLYSTFPSGQSFRISLIISDFF